MSLPRKRESRGDRRIRGQVCFPAFAGKTLRNTPELNAAHFGRTKLMGRKEIPLGLEAEPNRLSAAPGVEIAK